MKTESAGGLVVNDKREIALVFEEDFNGWVFPKGHVEKNESLEQASKREIFEETGLKNIKKIKFLDKIQRKEFGTGNIKIICCFLYKTQKQEQLKKGAKWFNLNLAKEKIHFKEEKDFLEEHQMEIIN